jgi:hypothetical protein
MKKENSITFIDLLQLMFIALKLIGEINWSWFWVLSPAIIYIFLYAISSENKKGDNQ